MFKIYIILQFNFRKGTPPHNIWLSDFTDYCDSYSTCLTACKWCPTSAVTSCSHSQDMTLECGKCRKTCVKPYLVILTFMYMLLLPSPSFFRQ